MENEPQLRLFDVPEQAPPRSAVARVTRLQLRQDHAVLLGMAALIGLAVIFALGVERGKQLVRSEQLLRRDRAIPREREPLPASRGAVEPQRQPADEQGPPRDVGSEPQRPHRDEPAQPRPKKARSNVATAEGSGYAVQVVTYKTATLAEKELARLQQLGEQAFLMEKQGWVVLFVGPFQTKEHAKAKLSGLKRRYEDCFLRRL